MAQTFLGAAALALAARIDGPPGVVGFAGLVRELRATMTAVNRASPAAKDAVDEILMRRDRKIRARQ